MEVQLAVLADAANIAPPGKLNILGIFDTVFVADFPAIHPSMVLALRLRLDYEDGAGEHDLEVVLTDEDGKEFMHGKARVQVPKIPPGEAVHLNQILSFAGTAFGSQGRYCFRLLWDGTEKQRIDLRVAKGPSLSK